MPDEARFGAEVARRLLRARRQRDRRFGDGLFADPAWDMLLDLYVMSQTGGRVSVGSLCAAAGVPQTTALRWIGVLERRDLIERLRDEQDGRRTLIRLTAAADQQMRQLLATIGQELRGLERVSIQNDR